MVVKGKAMGEVALIKVRGNLIGGDETTEVHEKVKRVISEGVTKIVIDLHRVKWMNSHGVGMLMGCYSSVQGVNGKIAICRVSEKAKEVLTLTKVITLFDSYESVRRAVKALRSLKV